MVVVALPDGTRTTHVYDATGLRRQCLTNHGPTHFLWDGQTVLAEPDGEGFIHVLYTNGLGAYGPLVAQRRRGTSSFFHFDAPGLDDGADQLRRGGDGHVPLLRLRRNAGEHRALRDTGVAYRGGKASH